jgi:mono/diheme cytochrome c family protein
MNRQIGPQKTWFANGWLWTGSYCALPLAAVLLSLLFLSGCAGIQRDTPIQVWDDMKHQQKFKAQAPIVGIFADGRSNRLPPEDTVSRNFLPEDSPYYTGMEGALYLGKNPVPVTMDLLRHGQMRFNTYCSPCHDQTGMGRGIVPTRVPTWQPSNLTEDRVVQFADGDIFNVITNGRRTMPAYRFQITVADRWAIIAYVRALQRAAHSKPEDVPAGTTIASVR